MTSQFSIKDLERVSGVKAHTLRIWEQRYEILVPQRSKTNIRYYDNYDLKKILNVAILNNNGYKISNIAKLNEKNLITEVEKFLNDYKDENKQIESLVFSLLEMNEDRFENTINQSIDNFGFEISFEKIIFPFIKKMGNMWQLGIVSPAQEHYITNLIRQKLIVAIDHIKLKLVVTPKKYIFFLPNQELHEMSLLYTHFLTKSKGHKCIYLGQSVPFEDLVAVSKHVKPDYIVSIFTATMPDLKLNSFLKIIDQKIKGPQFYFSGRLLFTNPEKVVFPSKKMKIFKDYLEFKALI